MESTHSIANEKKAINWSSSRRVFSAFHARKGSNRATKTFSAREKLQKEIVPLEIIMKLKINTKQTNQRTNGLTEEKKVHTLRARPKNGWGAHTQKTQMQCVNFHCTQMHTRTGDIIISDDLQFSPLFTVLGAFLFHFCLGSLDFQIVVIVVVFCCGVNNVYEYAHTIRWKIFRCWLRLFHQIQRKFSPHFNCASCRLLLLSFMLHTLHSCVSLYAHKTVQRVRFYCERPSRKETVES